MSDALTGVLQALRRLAAVPGPAPALSQPVSRALEPGQLRPELRAGDGRLRLPLPGLYGRHGVLPDYFTDELLTEHPEQATLREFLDIFNHRLYGHMLEIWQRYHFFAEDVLVPKTESARREAFYLNCLAGTLKPVAGAGQEPDPETIAFQALRWHKLSLYRRRARTADGLQELLRVFLPDLQIRLRCMVPVSRPLPSAHRFALDGQICLGRDGLLGESLVDLAGGIRLEVEDLTYAQYLSLQGRPLPGSAGSPLRGLVRELVAHYTRGRIRCFMTLSLRAEEVPAWSLGRQDQHGLDVCLGQQLWLHGARREAVSVDIGVV